MNIVKALTLAACACLCALSADVSAYTWQHVSAPGQGCRQFATAPDGSLYLATESTLSRWTGSEWLSEDTPAAAFAGSNDTPRQCDLRFSADGRPHIVYACGNSMVYCTKTASGWQSENIVTGTDWIPQSASIALDRYGVPYVPVVMGVAGVSERLYVYSRFASGNWSPVAVDTSYRATWWPDLEISPSGVMRMAYTTGASDDLKYVSGKAGSFAFQTLDSNGATGWMPSVEVTATGLARISYMNVSEDHSFLAVEQSPGVFSRYVVDNSVPQLFCDLALMADGTPIVTYVTADSVHLWPAGMKCAILKNGVFERFTVGNGEVLGTHDTDTFSSIVVGGNLYISYTDGATGTAQMYWTTVPEPCSVVALLMGVAGLAFRRRVK